MDMEILHEKCEAKQDEYDALEKQPLLVKLNMATPFSTIDFVRLDGILAYMSLREILGEVFYDYVGAETDTPLHAPLPLERSTGVRWYWHCSFGVANDAAKSITRWKKRWCDEHDDLVDFGNKLPRVDHKAGFFKAYDMPIVLNLATSVVFCCVGNMAEVERLAKQICSIGKKRSQGYGQVASVEILSSDQDWSCWIAPGQPTRAIPVEQKKLEELAMSPSGLKCEYYGYRPPYWHQSHRALCYAVQKEKNGSQMGMKTLAENCECDAKAGEE